MDEFSLINTFFKPLTRLQEGIIFGIGDDAACLHIPPGMDLLVSCDTLLENVHFLSDWNAYDIAYKAVMVNVSDIIAMGGIPQWITLALTIPQLEEPWLSDFSRGLAHAFSQYHLSLIGGDTTRGPLSMTLTIHGVVPQGKAVRRNGAAVGDTIYLSGEIGGAALAVDFLTNQSIHAIDRKTVMEKLLHPKPRRELATFLLDFATSAIDISDGLGADLSHICQASQVGACIEQTLVPIHPLVAHYKGQHAFDFALSGGDDYELCFTIAAEKETQFLSQLASSGLSCYRIGVIDAEPGLRVKTVEGDYVPIQVRGYNHF